MVDLIRNFVGVLFVVVGFSALIAAMISGLDTVAYGELGIYSLITFVGFGLGGFVFILFGNILSEKHLQVAR